VVRKFVVATEEKNKHWVNQDFNPFEFSQERQHVSHHIYIKAGSFMEADTGVINKPSRGSMLN
jgi:hypothetical protein